MDMRLVGMRQAAMQVLGDAAKACVEAGISDDRLIAECSAICHEYVAHMIVALAEADQASVEVTVASIMGQVQELLPKLRATREELGIVNG